MKFLPLLKIAKLAEIYIPLIQQNLGILNRPSNKVCFHKMRMSAITAKEIHSIQRYILIKRFFQFSKSRIVKKLNISTISYSYTITFLLNLENITSNRSLTIAFSLSYNSGAHFFNLLFLFIISFQPTSSFQNRYDSHNTVGGVFRFSNMEERG